MKRKEKVIKRSVAGKVHGAAASGKVHGDLMYDVVWFLPYGPSFYVGGDSSPLKEAEAKRDSYATASMLRADGIRYGIRPSV